MTVFPPTPGPPRATSDRSEADSVIAITMAAQAGELREIDLRKRYSVVVPDGYQHRVVDLTDNLESPEHITGTVHLQTVADFARYVARHDSITTTTLWANIESGEIVAVLDDHGSDGDDELGIAGWGKHRAKLSLTPTEEWQHWSLMTGQSMTQERFAEHIEDGLREIREPTGAEMLEIAQTLKGSLKAEWKSAKRLHDGTVQMVYVEEATTTAGGGGDLAIPERFKLGIAPFVGEEKYSVEARLRYRMEGGKVTLGYKLDRPDEVVRDAIKHIADRLASQFEGRVFLGTPR